MAALWPAGVVAQTAGADRSPCTAFNQLNDRIRDQTIGRREAQQQLRVLLPQIAAYYRAAGGKAELEKASVFPLEGYSANAIGGLGGNGYQPKGYDYFAGNRHKGHPAHDIFILDRDQDGRDDRTRAAVSVRAVAGGVVVATSTNWRMGSSLRGGNYVWVYSPVSQVFFYYAHNAEVRVTPGDLIRPGDVLATVGRTGKNAFAKRSPTHLHLMQLVLDDQQYPRPVNCYRRLLRSQSVR